jgi:hypothetical protein
LSTAAHDVDKPATACLLLRAGAHGA